MPTEAYVQYCGPEKNVDQFPPFGFLRLNMGVFFFYSNRATNSTIL